MSKLDSLLAHFDDLGQPLWARPGWPRIAITSSQPSFPMLRTAFPLAGPHRAALLRCNYLLSVANDSQQKTMPAASARQ